MPEMGTESQTTLEIRMADIKHDSQRDDELELLTAEGNLSQDYVPQHKEVWPRDENQTSTEGVCEPGCLHMCVFMYVCVSYFSIYSFIHPIIHIFSCI